MFDDVAKSPLDPLDPAQMRIVCDYWLDAYVELAEAHDKKTDWADVEATRLANRGPCYTPGRKWHRLDAAGRISPPIKRLRLQSRKKSASSWERS